MDGRVQGWDAATTMGWDRRWATRFGWSMGGIIGWLQACRG